MANSGVPGSTMNVRMFGIPTPPLDLVLAAHRDLQHIIR
jgi:hypothetical protein